MQYADTAIDGALGVSGVAFTIATLGAGAEWGLALAEGRLARAAAGRLALAGAAKGAILGSGLETGRQLLTKPKCKGLDGGLIADAAFAGAVSGALFGARGGIGPVAAGAGPRTFTSSDPLVADLANKIEAAYPGHVVGVNVPMHNAAGQ